MNVEEAIEEARRRWGRDNAWVWALPNFVVEVGVQMPGSSGLARRNSDRLIYGRGKSFEQAFADADDRKGAPYPKEERKTFS